MPDMVLNRNHTLNTLTGHTIRFEKDKPTYVPPVVVQAALAIGAEAVGDAAKKEVAAEVAKHDPKENPAELQGVERRGKVKEILEMIATRNQSGDFMASNRPKLDVINAELDFKVTASERDEIWNEILKERAEEAAA